VYPAATPRCKGKRFAIMGQMMIFLAGCLIVFLVFKVYPQLSAQPAAVQIFAVAAQCGQELYGDPVTIIKTGMPILNRHVYESDLGYMTPRELVLDWAGTVSRVNLLEPAGVLQSEMPVLAKLAGPVEKVTIQPVASSRPINMLSDECLVAIYNTHTGETYSLTDGVERLDGKKGGVVTVAAALQEELESKYGIKTARSERINDADYNSSYLEAARTAAELLENNPGTRVLLDIHRDAGKTREQSIVNINGQEVAPLLFIVGSDKRRPFPNWQQNYAFALKISDRLNALYPGLSQGVRVYDGVYNQSVHPQALLVEVGTTENSTEEAVRSARLLARVLALEIGNELSELGN
jgi:stage II sporulation protein P